LRHVWPVLASAATSSECGRGCGDLAFFIAPAMNPRTVCFCQPILSIISASVAPFLR
jgi:hypothetical protein